MSLSSRSPVVIWFNAEIEISSTLGGPLNHSMIINNREAQHLTDRRLTHPLTLSSGCLVIKIQACYATVMKPWMFVSFNFQEKKKLLTFQNHLLFNTQLFFTFLRRLTSLSYPQMCLLPLIDDLLCQCQYWPLCLHRHLHLP